MSFSIKPAKITLAPSIAKAMISARWADPHWKALFTPGTSCSTVIHETAARLPKNLTSGRATKRHQVAVSSTGEVVAYARWILPEHLATADPVVWPEAQVAEPTAEETEKFEQMFRDVTDDGKIRGLRMDMMEFRSTPLEEVDAKINEGGPFLFLDYLATAPEYQRQGIGAMLLKAGLEVADAHGSRSYVTSSVTGAKLYQNHGFEVVETVTIDYSQFGDFGPVTDYFMIREPRRRE